MVAPTLETATEVATLRGLVDPTVPTLGVVSERRMLEDPPSGRLTASAPPSPFSRPLLTCSPFVSVTKTEEEEEDTEWVPFSSGLALTSSPCSSRVLRPRVHFVRTDADPFSPFFCSPCFKGGGGNRW